MKMKFNDMNGWFCLIFVLVYFYVIWYGTITFGWTACIGIS